MILLVAVAPITVGEGTRRNERRHYGVISICKSLPVTGLAGVEQQQSNAPAAGRKNTLKLGLQTTLAAVVMIGVCGNVQPGGTVQPTASSLKSPA